MTDADKPGIRQRLRAVRPLPVVLVTLLLACAALTTWLYVCWYRPDRQTDAATADRVIEAARSGTVAMLTYAPDTVDDDLAAAKSHLTGDFLSYYEDFARQVVAPAAKGKSLKTSAEVVGAGVAELHPDSAAVLVFVNQITTSKEQPAPTLASRSVKVSLSKVDGNWLISRFDPL